MNDTLELTTIIPLGNRLIVKKDDAKSQTKGGIVLPDDCKIPTLTGRIIEIGTGVECMEISKLDRVICDPCRAIPVEFDQGNKRYIIPFDDVIGVIKKADCI